jgi:hypothetical protein
MTVVDFNHGITDDILRIGLNYNFSERVVLAQLEQFEGGFYDFTVSDASQIKWLDGAGG